MFEADLYTEKTSEDPTLISSWPWGSSSLKQGCTLLIRVLKACPNKHTDPSAKAEGFVCFKRLREFLSNH